VVAPTFSPETTLGPSHAFGLRFLPRKCYEVYRLDRDACRQARQSDYVVVNLYRTPLGEPMKLHAADELLRRLAVSPVTLFGRNWQGRKGFSRDLRSRIDQR
jgi:hypothetical protein